MPRYGQNLLLPLSLLLLAALGNHWLVTADFRRISLFSANTLALSFTWILLVAVSLFAASFLGNWTRASALVGILYVICGGISYEKRYHLGMPIFPTDFSALAEVEQVLPLNESYKFFFGCGFAILLAAAVYYAGRRSWRLPSRAEFLRRTTWLISGLLLTGVLVLKNNPVHDSLFSRRFRVDPWNPNIGMDTLGMAVSFIALLEQGELIPPVNYSPERAQKLWKKIEADSVRSPRRPAQTVKPDIIVIMSESLFDPLQLSGIQWKRDPLKFTRSLSKENMNRMVVPVFGGKTANTEFTFLTGHNLRFLSRGSVPYNSLIRIDMNSMARQLRTGGYHSVAIHPGTKKFWNRDKIYPLLGFESFISLDDFSGPDYFAGNPTDHSILPVLQNSLLHEKAPQFRFVVTIQNHWPFSNPFDLKDLAFDTAGLERDEVVALNHYVRGLEATDKFHRSLVEWLGKRGRPTVLLIFGDHLPALLPNFRVYKGRMIASENQREWSQDETLRMFRTPLVVWSNQQINYPHGNISASFAGLRLLESLDLQLDPYQNFLTHVSRDVPVLPRNLLGEGSSEMNEWIDQYAVLQYGILSHQVPESVAKSAVPQRSPSALDELEY